MSSLSRMPQHNAGMFLGAGLVGVHMASTHGISLAMLSSYIPATPIPGLGRVSGTAWSFTDFVLGALPSRVMSQSRAQPRRAAPGSTAGTGFEEVLPQRRLAMLALYTC